MAAVWLCGLYNSSDVVLDCIIFWGDSNILIPTYLPVTSVVNTIYVTEEWKQSDGKNEGFNENVWQPQRDSSFIVTAVCYKKTLCMTDSSYI